MRIDITRIDISHINKNKQSHRWVKLLSFFGLSRVWILGIGTKVLSSWYSSPMVLDLFEKFTLGFAKLGDELLIEGGQLVSLAVDQNVLVYLFIIHASFLDKAVPIQDPLGRGRDPHEGLGVLREKIELAGALENEDAAVDVIGKLVLDHLGKGKRRNVGVGVGDLNEGRQIVKGDLFLLCQGIVLAHDEDIGKFRDHFVGKSLFLQHGLEELVVILGVADDAQLVIVIENVIDGSLGVGFLIKDLGGIVADALGKLRECVRNVTGTGNRNGKLLFLRRALFVELFHVIDLLEDIFRETDKFLTLGSQHHTFCTSVEDGDTEIPLQLLDRTADIGLSDQKGLRRFIERAKPGYLYSVFNMEYIQNVTPFLSIIA